MKTIMEKLDDIIILTKQLREQTEELRGVTLEALSVPIKDIDLRNEAMAMTQTND